MNSRTIRALFDPAIAFVLLTVASFAQGSDREKAQPSTPEGYPSQGGAKFDPKIATSIEVKRAPTGHLLVKPRVDGHDAGWFIFDTGAGICVVSKTHVDEYELTAAGELDAAGVGSTKARLLRAKDFTLGPLTLEDLPMIELDLAFLKPHLGEEIAGIVGYGLLSRCVATIDLDKPAIDLRDPASFELKGCAWTPAELDTFIPVVKAKFEDHEGRFTLDTGANDPISFHPVAITQFHLLEGRATTDGKLGGVGGFVNTKRGKLSKFELGALIEKDFEVSFESASKANPNPRIAGNVGVGLLRKCILTTDYGRCRVAFVPREASTEVEKR